MPFKKGVSGNPSGQSPLPAEVRSARKSNRAALIMLVTKLFALKRKTKASTQLEQAVQGMITRAKDGDTPAFKYLIELICGAIPVQDYESPTEEMSPQEKLALMRQAVTVLEAQAKQEEPNELRKD